MPEVKAEDLEEFYTWRMTDQVVERAEQIIRQRYLWISVTGGIAFAVVTWLGGAAIISELVKARVDDAVIKQSQAIHDAGDKVSSFSGETKARLAQVDARLQDTQDTEKKLAQQLNDLKGEADSFKDSLGQIVSATNTLSKNSADIALLKTSVADLAKLSSAVAQLQSLLDDVAKQSPTLASKLPPAAAQSQAVQITENLVATNKKLAEATVFVQFSGAVSRAQIDAIRSVLQRNLEISVPPAERVASKVREVRYFYDGDKDLSDKVAAAAQSALSEGGFGDNIIVKSTPLLNYPKAKPPPGTVELWLGDLPNPRS
jgi:archaellum component FlaC